MFTKFALKRPVAIVVCLIALAIFGFSSLIATPLELTPSLSLPMFIVSTYYGGAGPEEVDSLVTSRVESAVSTLTGLKTVQSISSEGMSMVMLELQYGSDMNLANTNLQKKINSIANFLPEEAGDPMIIEMTMDSSAVIQMSAKPTGDMDVLNYLNDNIVPEFEKLSGVANVQVYGGEEKYVQVRLHPEKLQQYRLDMSRVSQALAAADFSIPAGSVEQGDQALTLRGGVSYLTPESLASMPLTLASGDIIHLSDIADVGEAYKKATSVSRYNGEETVSISVTKRDSASTNAVTQTVIQQMEQINAQNKGIQMSVTYNATDDIWESLVGVIQSMLLAIVISMVILYLFLGDFRASLIVGTSMPVSVLVTLIVMSFTGMTFNMLSMGGLTIGVGMMVDNSIVVLDSCFKKRDERRSFKEAALEGAGMVSGAVIASTLTTVVVFLPVALMKGMSGQLFKDAGFTIVFALIASLVSALTLVPLLFLQYKPREKKANWASNRVLRIEKGYESLIYKSFNHKKLVVFSAIALLIASFCMLPFIGVELMPSSDNGQVTMAISTRPGLKLENLDQTLKQIEEIVLRVPDLDNYAVSGSASPDAMSGSSSNANVTVYLKKDRTVKTPDVVEQLRRDTKEIVGCEIKISGAGAMSMGGSTDTVVIYLTGSNADQLKAFSEEVKNVMYQNPGIVHAASSITDGGPQATMEVDPVKAAAYGMSPAQIVSNVSSLVNGKEATTIRMQGRDYSIRVEYPDNTYQKMGDLAGIMLPTTSGIQVPLLDVARIQYSNSPQQIMRYNSQYVVSITGQTIARDSAKINNEVTTLIMGMQLPDGITHFLGGSVQTMNEEFAAIFSALGTAIFLVFMVMAIQFNSIRFSLMVMISVPFSLIGAFGGLLFTGTTISMTSLMGMILLVGIVVNNAIMLIDYANQLRESGMRVRNALAKAGRSRLRPILMTTLTTVLGMIPMAIGMGSNAAMMRGMSMVVIGGLSASTVLTLILIPTFYLIFSKKDDKNPNLRDDSFDPERPQIAYSAELSEDLNQSDDELLELPRPI